MYPNPMDAYKILFYPMYSYQVTRTSRSVKVPGFCSRMLGAFHCQIVHAPFLVVPPVTDDEEGAQSRFAEERAVAALDSFRKQTQSEIGATRVVRFDAGALVAVGEQVHVASADVSGSQVGSSSETGSETTHN
jgi:hypothetical protein